ncbi:MAG TPA: aminoacyl-histidine dipeptidase [Bacteroidales bacterium]|nr:aminoacyl-histidine dipeptidase [Bacteroidales bacterium]
MNEALISLKPSGIWQYFREITLIPRPSKKEEKIIAYLVDFAKQHNLQYTVDKVGNVVIKKPASQGFENRKTIVLQSHVDMVCEKNSDKDFDFDNDPIEVKVEHGWVKANGTTLGADDGIGMACQLAILADHNIKHGPIECLFTVDEETGLSGAFALESDLLEGRILLNLDSEDEGELFIGCAGGKDTVIKLPFTKVSAPSGAVALEVNVSGLKGGHSGDDIHRGLGNANKILNRLLWEIDKNPGIHLISFEGGNLRNAIAREARAAFYVDASKEAKARLTLEKLSAEIRKEYHIADHGLKIEVSTPVAPPALVVDEQSKLHLLNSLYACPHGVIAYSQTIPGFVETSTNLASVRMKDDHFLIATSQRSSVESAKHDIANMVRAVFELTGAEVAHGDGYPGWTPNPDSKIREITESAYNQLFGVSPKVKAIHAGLECGIIGDKYPGMDMISYGPTIKGAHSPDERIEIASVQKFWDLTLEVLKSAPSKD